MENEWTKTFGVFLGYIFHWTIWFREISSESVFFISATKQSYSRKCCHDFGLWWQWGLCFVCFVFCGAVPCQTKEELICDPADVEANIPGNFRRGNAVIATRSLVRWQVLAVWPEQDLTKWLTRPPGGGNSNILYFHPYWREDSHFDYIIFFKGVETTN